MLTAKPKSDLGSILLSSYSFHIEPAKAHGDNLLFDTIKSLFISPLLRISHRVTTSQTLGLSLVSNPPAAEHREPNNALLSPAQENLKERFKLKDGTQESPSANMRTHEPIS